MMETHSKTAIILAGNMEVPEKGAERIRSIVESVPPKDATFTSVATVVASVLQQTHAVEKNALKAAISLAQRDMLEAMCLETRTMVDALLPFVRTPAGVGSSDSEQSWWFALSEATETLGDGIDRLSAIVGRQEKGSAVRDLAALAVRVLRDHRQDLVREADDWMNN